MWHTLTGFFILLTSGVLLAQTPTTNLAPQSDTLNSVLRPDTLPTLVIAPPVQETAAKGNARIVDYILDSTLTKAVEFANIAFYNTLTCLTYTYWLVRIPIRRR